MKFAVVPFICLLHYLVEASNHTPSICKVIPHEDKPLITDFKSNNFSDFIKSSYMFVDKSLLIEFLMGTSTILANVISAPPRWGKSINLDMLRFFLEMNVMEDGKIVPANETNAYKFFVEGKIHQDDGTFRQLEQPPQISTKHEIIKTYLAQYPVIKLDFNDMVSSIYSYKDFIPCLKSKIAKIFALYPYLEEYLQKQDDIPPEDSDEEPTNDADIFRSFKNKNDSVKGEHLGTSIHFLCKVLLMYFDKKPVILFDGYDVILKNLIITERYVSDDTSNNVLRIFKLFMTETFKRNQFYKKGVLTGDTQIKANDLGNPKCDDIIVTKHAIEFYGFVQSEVDMLLSAKGMSEYAAQLKHWYGGYRCIEDPTIEYYNMFSVLKFINQRNVVSYWNNTGSGKLVIEALVKNLHLKLDLQILLNNNSHVNIFKEKLKFSSFDLRGVMLFFKEPNCTLIYKIKHDRRETLFAILVSYGYLTATLLEENKNLIQLTIPNTELRNEIFNRLDASAVNLLGELYNKSMETALAMEEFLNNNDAESEKLSESIKALYQERELFDNIKQQFECWSSDTLTKMDVKDENEATMHEVMLSVLFLLKKRSTHPLPTEFQYNGRRKDHKRKDLFFYNSKRVIIIKLKSNATEVMEEIKNQEAALSKSTFFQEKQLHFDAVKYVGVSVSNSREVVVVSTMKSGKDLDVLNVSNTTVG